jgi:hypothetical protein
MVEMIVEGELTRPDVVIFADTGDEPDYVYRQLDYLKGRLQSIGMTLATVQKSSMVEDIYGGARFAALPLFTVNTTTKKGFGIEAIEERVGRLKRQCTSEYKIVPIERHIREMLLERGQATRRKNGIYINKGVMVETWLGITLDEAERMRPNRTKWITNRWPLIEKRMTRQDCIKWLQNEGLPVPHKSSCIRCPFHNNNHWQQMKQDYPSDWIKVTTFDDDLRNGTLRLGATARGRVYLHRDCKPIRGIDFSNSNGQASFAFCDEGHCWT